MLLLIQSLSSIPLKLKVDPTATFQPGQIAQLKIVNNEVVCGVSNGLAPIGVIDDVKNSTLSSAVEETVIVSDLYTILNGKKIVLLNDVKKELKNTNIIPSSFVSAVDVELTPRNGTVTFPKGTPLNFDADNDGFPDSIRTEVRYSFDIYIGPECSCNSGWVDVWAAKFLAKTDQYDTKHRYCINSALYVNDTGLLTPIPWDSACPPVAIVTGSPTAQEGMLEFLWG